MSQVLKPGDIVRLKSGGPKMIVEQKRGEEWHCVRYEVDRHEFVWNNFMPEVLVLAAEPHPYRGDT